MKSDKKSVAMKGNKIEYRNHDTNESCTGELALPRVNPLLPAFTLWWREVVRFYRQPARVVGVVVSPLLFWVVIGAGFGTSLQKGATGTGNFLNYFFPGALMMIVLFTSIFTMMSVIEDRNEGFLLSVMVAPVHRSGIVLGEASLAEQRSRPSRDCCF